VTQIAILRASFFLLFKNKDAESGSQFARCLHRLLLSYSTPLAKSIKNVLRVLDKAFPALHGHIAEAPRL